MTTAKNVAAKTLPPTTTMTTRREEAQRSQFTFIKLINSCMKITQILSETIEASQDFSALMQGIEHDLANRDREIDENLRKWFKDKWVRFGPDGKIRGDCARGSSSEGKPKCLPQSKAHSLGKKGRKKAASRKRREDPNKNRKGKAKNVKTK